jgi:PAS domain S-box-containing protein/putative nucleotidyltransferase with HDIG domain
MSKPKILVVEDEGLVAKSIQSMLNNMGYEAPDAALSGEKAIKKADEIRPDLILMDIKLKGEMDGIEAAEIINERFGIPVVYLTAYADEDTLQRAKITEPFGYLLKPFEEQDLQSTIEMALYKSKMEQRLKEREHWFSTVLQSIGDAVIATDKNGEVTFMNIIAESLTGDKKEKALGKKLTDRFHIRVLNEEGLDINKAGQALLIDRKKTEIPVDYSNAPIKDDKSNNMGSVLVLRDVTERMLAQKELKQSFEKVQRILEEIIQAISRIVEARDPYTAGHQQRVANLACAIAEEMGLSKNQVDGIRMAGAIHDIGKLYVPAEILSKPTNLSDAEMTIVKSHPQVGYDILKGIEFPWPVAEMVLQHHERMLGDGYPAGLRGEEILIEARILAVADVVEAMSSHRPYRPALGIKKALEEISTYRGHYYDPVVADACMELFRKKWAWITEEMEKPIFT